MFALDKVKKGTQAISHTSNYKVAQICHLSQPINNKDWWKQFLNYFQNAFYFQSH